MSERDVQRQIGKEGRERSICSNHCGGQKGEYGIELGVGDQQRVAENEMVEMFG